MKVRKFVNVITEKYRGDWYDAFTDKGRSGLYSLRRVNAGNLFYGSTEEALLKEAEQEAMAAADPSCKKEMPRSRLPNPLIKFNQSRPVDGRTEFWPFYGAPSGSKILCVDAAGEAVLYDARAGTLETMPRLRAPMESDPDPVALSVALPDPHDPARPDALYVMDQSTGTFEALLYADPYDRLGRCVDRCVWRWRQLPMPPFIRDPSHGSIGSYALLPEPDVGGGTICVSSSTGTYRFNTASERWTKAGSWMLPFHGRCQVVPELSGLCFGVARDYPNQLRSMDACGLAHGTARRPKLRYRWPFMDGKPAGWSTTDTSMVYMGAGKFCLATSYHIYHQDDGDDETHETVLNGVEVVREDGRWTSKFKSKFRIIRHKSVCYRLLNHRIHVL